MKKMKKDDYVLVNIWGYEKEPNKLHIDCISFQSKDKYISLRNRSFTKSLNAAVSGSKLFDSARLQKKADYAEDCAFFAALHEESGLAESAAPQRSIKYNAELERMSEIVAEMNSAIDEKNVEVQRLEKEREDICHQAEIVTLRLLDYQYIYSQPTENDELSNLKQIELQLASTRETVGEQIADLKQSIAEIVENKNLVLQELAILEESPGITEDSAHIRLAFWGLDMQAIQSRFLAMDLRGWQAIGSNIYALADRYSSQVSLEMIADKLLQAGGVNLFSDRYLGRSSSFSLTSDAFLTFVIKAKMHEMANHPCTHDWKVPNVKQTQLDGISQQTLRQQHEEEISSDACIIC